MKSHKNQSGISSKSNYNKMGQQEDKASSQQIRSSKSEKSKFKAPDSTPNDDNEHFPSQRVNSTNSNQNFTERSSAQKCQGKIDAGIENQTDLNGTTLEAVQKCLDHTLRAYFIHTMEKIECLSGQLLRNECMFAKMHLDLVERISKLCDRNLVQYQSLTERLDSRVSGERLRETSPYRDISYNEEYSDDIDQYNEISPRGPSLVPLRLDSSPKSGSDCEMKCSDDNRYSDCEEKIYNLNEKLKSTRKELDDCISRLQQIKDFEEIKFSNQATTTREKPPGKEFIENELDLERNKHYEISDEDKTAEGRQKAPLAPLQPESVKTQSYKEQNVRLSERKIDYDSEPVFSSSKRHRSIKPDRKRLTENQELQQNSISQCKERKKYSRS